MMTSSPFGVSLPRAAASSAVLAPIATTATVATTTTAVMSPAKKRRLGLWLGIGIALGAVGTGVGYLVLRRS